MKDEEELLRMEQETNEMRGYGELPTVEIKTDSGRKCPRCRGFMEFDPKEGKLRCLSCDYVEAVLSRNEEETNAEELDFIYAEREGNHDWGVEKKTVRCENCGIEMIYDKADPLEECLYCGSGRITEVQTEDILAPGGVCVFELDARQAAERFETWIRKRWFCRKELKGDVQPKNLKGIYVPCWTFDTHTHTTYDADYGVNYPRKGVMVMEWDGCCGEYKEFIDDQVVDGSTRHKLDFPDIAGAFHTADNKAYRQEYLAGFAVERYSVDLKDAWENAKESIFARLRRHVTNKILAVYHADDVKDLNITTVYDRIQYKHLLLPVWVICFHVKGKLYRFTVNGQNGSVSGKVPLSAGKIASVVLGGLAVLGCLCFFLCR